MIRLEPQHDKIPNDILARAENFGRATLTQGLYKDQMAIKAKGGFYLLEALQGAGIVRVKILEFIGNFLTHIRSGGLKLQPYFDNQTNQYYLTGIDGGGYRENLSELANRYTYPLQDDDRGTWVVNTTGPAVEWTSGENYGNCYWWDGEKDGQVLSWKGPPNGLSISGAYNIPGLSQIENTVGTTLYYTTFGVYIYRDGDYLAHGPQWFVDNEMATLVAGAMYIGSVLCCLTVTNKQPDGFWLQLWTTADDGKNWKLIKEVPVSSRLRMSAQISKDGMTFHYDGTVYKIIPDKSDFTSSFTAPATSKGRRTVVGQGGQEEGSYHYSGTTNIWPGLSPTDSLEYSSLTVDAKFDFTKTSSGGYQKSDQPVYRGNPATAVTVRQYGVFSNNEIWFIAEANGSYCTMDWSGVDRVENGFGIKKTQLCNSDYSITATANPQGVSGTFTQTYIPTLLSVSGPYDMAVGSVYGVSNAIGEIRWEITQGKIVSGVITELGNCGEATITVRDQCKRSAHFTGKLPNGHWIMCDTGKNVGANGYFYDYGSSPLIKRWVTQFFSYCSSFATYDDAYAWASGVFSASYAPLGWMGIESVGWSQACHDEVSQPMWVGVYYEAAYSFRCDNQGC